jgi:regulator of protease activity HflC (stomatin/prohibitin superfamily)
MVALGFFAGVFVFALYLVGRCWFRVEEGEVAVLTNFGAALRDGQSLRRYRSGFHWKAPWQQVHSVKAMEQSLDLSGEAGGTSAMAYDGTVLRFDSNMRYLPVEERLDELLFGLRRPMEHITGLFTCLLRNEIANFGSPTSATAGDDSGGSYALIRKERRLLNERIEEFCKDKIDEKYGVRFSAVDLVDILPPDDLDRALNAVAETRAEAESAYYRSEADCSRRVVAAERGVEVAAARAKAAELEIDELASFLAELQQRGVLDRYVKRRRMEVLAQSRALFLGSES